MRAGRAELAIGIEKGEQAEQASSCGGDRADRLALGWRGAGAGKGRMGWR